MAELLFGTSVFVVAVALVMVVAICRRRRFADVFRQNGDRLFRTAQGLVVGGLITAFVILAIINNR